MSSSVVFPVLKEETQNGRQESHDDDRIRNTVVVLLCLIL
jgi:hypothetical protein